MNKVFCTRCGSTSHTAFDCSAPDRGLAPPAASALDPAPGQQPGGEDAPSEALDGLAGLPDRESGPVLSTRPRHPAWPLTCEATGLLAFDGEGDVKAFTKKWSPRCKMTKVWVCETCGRTHFDAKAPSPSGDESGHPRESRLPRNPFKPFRRAPMRPSAFENGEADLPRQPDRPKKAEPAVLPAPRKTRAKPGRQEALF